jgi:RHS repeat-associated protein
LITYNTGLGATWANSSSRINTIQDVRALPDGPNGAYETYTFTYNSDAIPHLTQIANIVGNAAESYTLSYLEGQTLMSPFTPQVSFGTTTLLQSVNVTTLGFGNSFTYDASGSAELSTVTTPFGGRIRWAYRPFTYVGSRTLREVQDRYVTTTYSGTESQAYVFTRNDSVDEGLTIHSGVTIDDPSGIGEKAWTFSTTGSAWQLGMTTLYADRPSAALANQPYRTQQFTWVQDAAGNPYISTALTTLDPASANVQTQTTQTLDTNGNVLTSNIYGYGNLTTPAATYTNTYLTNSNYTSRYILNRLVSSIVNNPSQTVTLVSNTYDSSSLTNLPGVLEHDAAYSTSFVYRGNVTSTAQAGSPTITIARDIGGNAVSTSDGVTTTSVTTSSTTNYAAPSVITPNSNSNLQTSLSYTSWLGTSSVTGPNGATAATNFDAYGRPSSSTSIYGAKTTYGYSSSLPYVISTNTTNSNGTSLWTYTTLDGFGRTIEVQRGTGASVVSEVDTAYGPCACSPLQKVAQVSQPYVPGNTVYWTKYTYDGLGRTVSVLLPDTASTTTYAYSGNNTTLTDPAGKWKMQTKDVFGNLTVMNEPNPAGGANYVTSYTYDVLNHLTQVSMPRPSGTQTRTFVYSSTTQWLTSETHPESGTKTYTYNSDGTLATRIDANGNKTVYTYDAYKRLTMKSYWYLSSGTWTEATLQRLTLTYDTNSINSSYSQNAWGRLTTAQWNVVTNCESDMSCGAGVTPGTNTQMYSYTPAGQIAGKSLQVSLVISPAGGGTTIDTFNLAGTFGYDNQGRMTTITYPQTYTLNSYYAPIANPTQSYNYSYDGMEREYSVGSGSSQTNVAASAQYGPSDELLQLNNGSGGPIETRTYNTLVQLKTVNTNLFEYNYSATQNNGRIISANHLAGSVSESLYYTYDSLNRLSTASGSGVGTVIPAWSESYTYDGFGNLTDKTPTGGAPLLEVATHAGTNHITGETYDANGNTTSFIVGENEYSYTYDYENRLVTSAGDTYSYGPDNLRTYKIQPNGNEYVYFYDPFGRRMGAYQISSPGWEEQNVYCVCGETTALWFAGTNLTNANGNLPDRLGSVTSGNGFFPYGEEYTTPTVDGDDFATYYHDVDTGLDYAQNRYYSSILGRFLNPDPYMGSMNPTNPNSFNRYSYVMNDPVNSNDPSGLGCFADEDDPDGNDIGSPCISMGGDGYCPPEFANCGLSIGGDQCAGDSFADGSGCPRQGGTPTQQVSAQAPPCWTNELKIAQTLDELGENVEEIAAGSIHGSALASLDNLVNTDVAEEFLQIMTMVTTGPPTGPDYVGGHFNLVLSTIGLQQALGSSFGIFNRLLGGTHDGTRQDAVYGNARQGNFTLHSKQNLGAGTFTFHFDIYNPLKFIPFTTIQHLFGDYFGGHFGTPCLDPAWGK